MRIVFGTVFSLLFLGLYGCSTTGPTSTTGLAASVPPITTKSTLPIVPSNSAASKALTELINCDGELKYIPVPAFQATDYTDVQLVNGTPKAVRRAFPSDKAGKADTVGINRLLPNLSMDVSSEEIKGDGQAYFFKADLSHRRIVMDFMKSRTEPIVDSADNFYGFGRVGAGLRLKIDLWTSENSFDGSLIGLAASAKAKTAYGQITAETVGVDNSDVTLSMPFTADFSEGSIQKIIEALAVIKSRLHDKANTTLVPHFLARVTCDKTPRAVK